MLNIVRWFFTLLTSIALVVLGFGNRFAYTTQIIEKWKGDSEDLTPHGVYSSASLCDAYAICMVCDVPRIQEAFDTENAHSFDIQSDQIAQST